LNSASETGLEKAGLMTDQMHKDTNPVPSPDRMHKDIKPVPEPDHMRKGSIYQDTKPGR